jgi:hypothetical protein
MKNDQDQLTVAQGVRRGNVDISFHANVNVTLGRKKEEGRPRNIVPMVFIGRSSEGWESEFVGAKVEATRTVRIRRQDREHGCHGQTR